MSRRVCVCAFLLLSFVLTLVDNADAWPRFRRRNTSYGGGGGSASIAVKVDREATNHRKLRVVYDYDEAENPEFAFEDRIQVFLRIFDEELLDVEVPLVAEVKLIELTASDTTHVKWCPVTLEIDPDTEEQVGTFLVQNEPDESIVRPAGVYRLFVSLHRESQEYGDESVVGHVATPYYVATSGEALLDQARQQIVMRTFREFYYTERGWDRNAEYPMHCVQFYRWATGHCTVGSSDGWTNLNQLFWGRNSYRNGRAIPGLNETGAVHGDYLATATHVFMLLAYDPDTGLAWTMEGNFNHTIEVCLRPVSSSWIVGHLAEEHILAEVIRPGTIPTEQADAVALSHSETDASTVP